MTNHRGGFTLVEVILALTILLVVLMMLATSTGKTVHTVATASAQEAAIELAMSRIEQIRAEPQYNTIDSIYAKTETGFPTLPGYTRVTKVVRVGGVGLPNDYKKITVTVTGPGVTPPVSRSATVAAP
jgi:prepilin-type N-terminal cleavage/methylation domain-containing protein